MSEKLTRERFYRWIQSISRSQIDVLVFGNAENLWAAIEADREAIRAETREELLKDHFKPNERVERKSENGDWEDGHVCFQSHYVPPIGIKYQFRRPPKKRAMTREERMEAIVKELVSHPNRQWSTDIIDAVCRELGLPTEVEE